MLLRPVVTDAVKSIASLPPPAPLATIATSVMSQGLVRAGPPAFVVLDTIRGGSAESAFNLGLAKTRLEGLAYSTVTTLMMNAALRLFSSTPKKLKPIPDNDAAKNVRFNNILVILFSMCISVSVALGAYTTIVFTLMSIYSKTALGMGLENRFSNFFESCAPYRQSGFRAFLGAIFSYNAGFVLSLILNYEGEIRWFIAMPAFVVALAGLLHIRNIVHLAGTCIYGL